VVAPLAESEAELLRALADERDIQAQLGKATLAAALRLEEALGAADRQAGVLRGIAADLNEIVGGQGGAPALTTMRGHVSGAEPGPVP
jgi:hypothetical protein